MLTSVLGFPNPGSQFDRRPAGATELLFDCAQKVVILKPGPALAQEAADDLAARLPEEPLGARIGIGDAQSAVDRADTLIDPIQKPP